MKHDIHGVCFGYSKGLISIKINDFEVTTILKRISKEEDFVAWCNTYYNSIDFFWTLKEVIRIKGLEEVAPTF